MSLQEQDIYKLDMQMAPTAMPPTAMHPAALPPTAMPTAGIDENEKYGRLLYTLEAVPISFCGTTATLVMKFYEDVIIFQEDSVCALTF